MNVNTYLKNLRATGKDSDFSIFVYDENGKKIKKKAHKLVIKQAPYFKARLDQENDLKEETLNDVDSETLDYVLDYLYTGNLSEMDTDQAVALIAAAYFLGLPQLKAIAVERWQQEFQKLTEYKDILMAFQTLVDESEKTPISITGSGWEPYVDKVLVASCKMYGAYSVAYQSQKLLEIFVDFYGSCFPHYSLSLLNAWLIPNPKRANVTATLVKKVNMSHLSLRTIVYMSRSPAFPAEYMLSVLQKRAETDDRSMNGVIIYELQMKKNRIVELEHHTGPALFQVNAFDLQHTTFWSILVKPKSCTIKVEVKQGHTWLNWPDGSLGGTLGNNYRTSDIIDRENKINFRLTFTPENNQSKETSSWIYRFD